MKKITLALTLGSLALAACGSSSDNSSQSADAGSAATNTTAAASSTPSYGGAYSGGSKSSSSSSASSTASGSKVTEAMYDNYFGTKTISGKPGAKVTVKLVNKGSNEHNFKIDSQKGVDADVDAGETKTVTLTIPKSGSVQFYCEYHKGIGMVGSVKAS